MMSIGLSVVVSLHLLAAIFWVGGMFLAYRVLRPASLFLEPPARLNLWLGVFSRFFAWVWVFILILIVSGYVDWMLRFGGLETIPLYLHLMQAIGWLMVALFAWLYFKPFQQFKAAVNSQAYAQAGAILNSRIRPIIAINLFLGSVEAVIGSVGMYF